MSDMSTKLGMRGPDKARFRSVVTSALHYMKGPRPDLATALGFMEEAVSVANSYKGFGARVANELAAMGDRGGDMPELEAARRQILQIGDPGTLKAAIRATADAVLPSIATRLMVLWKAQEIGPELARSMLRMEAERLSDVILRDHPELNGDSERSMAAAWRILTEPRA